MLFWRKKTGGFSMFLTNIKSALSLQKTRRLGSELREKELDAYIKNKILYDVKQRFPNLGELSSEDLSKMCNAAALMGRVAYADDDFAEEEKLLMVHGFLMM